jgi:hypothetical protein
MHRHTGFVLDVETWATRSFITNNNFEFEQNRREKGHTSGKRIYRHRVANVITTKRIRVRKKAAAVATARAFSSPKGNRLIQAVKPPVPITRVCHAGTK